MDLVRIEEIERILADMENGVYPKELLDDSPELSAKIQENEKLKYRLNILKRAASDSDPNSSSKGEVANKSAKCVPPAPAEAKAIKYFDVEDYGDSIIEKLNDLFAKPVNKIYPDILTKFNVRETNNPNYGDYQFDACFQIASRISAAQNVKTNPRDVANNILKQLERIPLVEKFEIANAFINVFLNKEYLGKEILMNCIKGISTPKIGKKHVIVDYSSPNIAKQMHVGHLRSTIIGDSIARLLELVGFSVLRLNHVGDWGTQFGMLIAYLRERYPNYLKEPPQIEDLQTFYKESKIKFDEDADFKAHAYQCVVKLQNFEPDIVNAWKMICDVSRKDFDNIYKRLDVAELQERGESFYQSRMQSTVQELEQSELLIEDGGRKLFFPEECHIPLTLVKSDGGYTYDTSDLTAIKQRIFEEKADWILYVVDRGQSEHLETVFAAARQLGWYSPKEKRIEHVQFGLVLGEDKKKFKTRSGDTVKLQDLLDEGVRRSKEKLLTKENVKNFSEQELNNAAESLAYGCIKYADLSQSRICDYVFSFDRMLDDRGNTAVYLLYAYTRIRSIARNAQISREEINKYLQGLENGVLPLEHSREIRLAKQILKFSDCLLTVLENLQLNKICDYIYELATLFHDFYKDCYVVSKVQEEGSDTIATKVDINRLALCELTADVMLRCFHILGIRPIDRM